MTISNSGRSEGAGAPEAAAADGPFLRAVGYDLQFDNPIFGPRYYHCGTQALGLKHAGVCRIESRVACLVEDSSMNPLFQVVATGMLDVHRTTPSCQRILRRAGQ